MLLLNVHPAVVVDAGGDGVVAIVAAGVAVAVVFADGGVGTACVVFGVC